MNKFYLSIALVFSFNFSFSAPTIKSIKNGYWNQASTWDLNRLPQVGDTIVIVAGHTVTVNNDIVLNGASAMKVYGKLSFLNNNSTLSFGNNSLIQVYPGALIMGGGSPSQKLKMNGHTIFDGNDDPVYGPMQATDASNGFIAMANTPPIALPVKFLAFNATSKGSEVLIQWSTSGEINVGKYDVERSIDGNNWTVIATMSAKANGSSINTYTYTDKNVPVGLTYYRIKETGVDGKETFSAMRSLHLDAVNNTAVKISAAQNKVLLQFPQGLSGTVVVRFVSTGGTVVDQQFIQNPVGDILLNTRFTGNYIISVSNGKKINTATQVAL